MVPTDPTSHFHSVLTQTTQLPQELPRHADSFPRWPPGRRGHDLDGAELAEWSLSRAVTIKLSQARPARPAAGAGCPDTMDGVYTTGADNQGGGGKEAAAPLKKERYSGGKDVNVVHRQHGVPLHQLPAPL